MPINSSHPQHAAHLPQWQRCRDAVAGSDAIKLRGVAYLPKLSGQSDEEYTAYKLRALWYGASARTVQGLTGAVMRKDPTVEVPKALEEHLKDVTLSGISFTAFAKKVLEEVLITGRFGVLVDMPAVTHAVQRPYYAAYTAESIVNWKAEMTNGVSMLVWVVLCEQVWVAKPDDPYQLEAVEQYRVLRMVEGHYEVETYRKSKVREGAWESQGVVIPTFRGTPLTFIPFCFFGPNEITPEIAKPPILDLVDVNLDHYRLSADRKHGLHFCGLPVYFFSGLPETASIKIGSSQAILASDPNARGEILEMSGDGLGPIGAELERDEQLMAVLGARLLEESKGAVEAADTLQVRHAGEQSVLRSVAGTVGIGLSKVLEWAGVWSGILPEEAKKATAKLNMDFMDAAMTFDDATKLMGLWQSSAITYETFYYNLQKGELTRPGVDWQKERAQIEVETPAPLPQYSLPDLAGLGG